MVCDVAKNFCLAMSTIFSQYVCACMFNHITPEQPKLSECNRVNCVFVCVILVTLQVVRMFPVGIHYLVCQYIASMLI